MHGINPQSDSTKKITSTRTSIKSETTTEPKTTSKNNITETGTIDPQKDDKEICQ